MIFDGGIQAHTGAGPGKNGFAASSRRTIEPHCEGRLHLEHRVIDRRPEAFVQDLDPEQLGGSGGAVFVGRGHGDVEGQDLVGVPGQGGFLEALNFGERNVVELFDGGIDGHGDIALERRVEHAGGVGRQVEILLELGTDVVPVGEDRLTERMNSIYMYISHKIWFTRRPPGAPERR